MGAPNPAGGTRLGDGIGETEGEGTAPNPNPTLEEPGLDAAEVGCAVEDEEVTTVIGGVGRLIGAKPKGALEDGELAISGADEGMALELEGRAGPKPFGAPNPRGAEALG